jgi:hypothetical protein
MRTNRICNPRSALLLFVLCLVVAAFAVAALGQSPVKINAVASMTPQPGGPHALYLAGEASHLGNFECVGEITLVPGDREGELMGVGVAALTAANGDVLVGVVTNHTVAGDCGCSGGNGDSHTDSQSEMHFSWRDSVQFSDGTIARSTGRFERLRPPGAVFYCSWVCIYPDGVPICRASCRDITIGSHGR